MAALEQTHLLVPRNPTPDFTQDQVDPTPFVRTAGAGLSQLELLVRGAKCAGCLSKIERAMTAIDGVTAARLNLSTGRLRVTWRDGTLAPVSLLTTLQGLGYPSVPFDPAAAVREEDATGRELLKCLAVAGFAMANIMLLSVSVWADHEGAMGDGTRMLFHFISALIAIPAALYAGRPFFRSAWAALRARQANMDVPISLAVVLALGMSVGQLLQQGEHFYFEAAVMLLFFLLIGRYLDHRLRNHARAAARELIALQAVTATRIGADGRLEALAVRDIAPGDRLLLAPGDRVPVDGIIESGEGDVDRALVTGESLPVAVGVGDTLHAGIVNLNQSIVMRARSDAEGSLVADLARLIEAGEQTRNRFVRLADLAARAYVPIVHGLALLTFLGWLIIAQAGVEAALLNAIALLIITCPCALGLAVPAVQVVATGQLFKSGILVKSGDALERLAQTTRVVFDKTGTLTLGRPRLINGGEMSAQDRALGASLARGSRHPLARALADAEGMGPVADDLKEVPGQGLEATVDGSPVRLGRAEWVGLDGPATDHPDAMTLYVRKGEGAPVRFLFQDRLREDAAETVAELGRLGLPGEMLSGDREETAAHVSGTVGLETFRANLSPRDKIARLEELKEEGERVLMIGDGLNDAPALAAAHASMSPGTAVDVAQASADLVFQGDRLGPVVDAVVMARAARRRVLENFAFAALYNVCAVPLAAAGLVTPLIAAIAMSGSSILVTLNALRLMRHGKA